VARPTVSRGGLHVGRYLIALVVLLLGLCADVVFGGPGGAALKPKLALDLQGGASVILTPQTDNGRPPQADQLQTALGIIERRVNGLGVAEAQVVTQGSNIVVSVPGGTRSALATLATTAQLRFREVLEQQASVPSGLPLPTPGASGQPPSVLPSPTAGAGVPPAAPPSASPTSNGRAVPPALDAQAPTPPGPASASPAPNPTGASPAASPTAAAGTTAPAAAQSPRSGDPYTPAAFAALDCSTENARKGGVNDKPDEPIISCSDDGRTKYHLDVAPVVGTDVAGANARLDQFGTGWLVSVDFTGQGQSAFTALTQRTVGKQVAIVLDGLTLSAPRINTVINTSAEISGSFDQKSATALANTLKYGALPLTFTRSEESTVSPTLGRDQLSAGLLAGGLGLLAVVVYSLLYYRALGLITIASLAVSGLLTYAFVVILGDQIGFALSLAGIAGFIVAVGITADSFVVFFERLKDEIQHGRTPRSAVDRAWVRARRTILSADTVSFLAALILYTVSVGAVRGFAFTLGLSTLLDVVVVFLFTRPLISWLSRFRWFSRTGPTGFTGPDGAQPRTGRAASGRPAPGRPAPGRLAPHAEPARPTPASTEA